MCKNVIFSVGIVTFTVVVVVVEASVLVEGFTVVVCIFCGFFVVVVFFGVFVVLATIVVAFVVTGFTVVVLFIAFNGVELNSGTEVVVVVVVVVVEVAAVAGVVVDIVSLLFDEVCSLFAIAVVVDTTVVDLTVVYFKEFVQVILDSC